jgi:hypothetical protein
MRSERHEIDDDDVSDISTLRKPSPTHSKKFFGDEDDILMDNIWSEKEKNNFKDSPEVEVFRKKSKNLKGYTELKGKLSPKNDDYYATLSEKDDEGIERFESLYKPLVIDSHTNSHESTSFETRRETEKSKPVSHQSISTHVLQIEELENQLNESETRHANDIFSIEKKHQKHIQELGLKGKGSEDFQARLKEYQLKLKAADENEMKYERIVKNLEKQLVNTSKESLEHDYATNSRKAEEKNNHNFQKQIMKLKEKHSSEIEKMISLNNSEIANNYETITELRQKLLSKEKMLKTIQKNEANFKLQESEVILDLKSRYEAELKLLDEDLEISKLNEKNVRTKVEKYEVDIDRLNNDLHESNARFKDIKLKLADAESSATNELRRLKKELQLESNAKLTKLETELKELKTKEAHIQNELARAKRSVEVFREAAKTSEGQVIASNEISKRLQTDLQKTRTEMQDKCEFETMKYKDRFKKLVKEMQSNNDDLKERLNKASFKLTDSRKDHHNESALLRRDIKKLEQDLERVRNLKESSQDQASKKSQQVLLMKIESLNEQIERMAKSASRERKQHQLELSKNENEHYIELPARHARYLNYL